MTTIRKGERVHHSIWLVWVWIVLLMALSWALLGCAGPGDSPSHPVYAHCI